MKAKPDPTPGQVWWNPMTRGYYVIYSVKPSEIKSIKITPLADPWKTIRRVTWSDGVGIPDHYQCQYNPKD